MGTPLGTPLPPQILRINGLARFIAQRAEPVRLAGKIL